MRRHGLSRIIACAIPLTLGAVACYHDFSTRALFAQLTYSGAQDDAGQDAELQLFASLELETITSYFRPDVAARCLRAVTPAMIHHIGVDIEATPTVEEWARKLLQEPLPPECPAPGEPDRALLTYSIGRLATVVVEGGLSPDIAAKAEAHIADIVAKTHVGAHYENAAKAPALALSGGSANGAFIAGFLFELLSVRERALAREPDPVKRRNADETDRFGVLVGTSVGALISQLVDLYFVDSDASLSKTQEKALGDCVGWWGKRKPDDPVVPVTPSTTCFDGYPEALVPGQKSIDLHTKTRLPQACALTSLAEYFTSVTEHDLLCVEPGAVTAVEGVLGQAHPNLVRFDPMSSNVLIPFISSYGDLMFANDATRVVVSVEMQQNQTLGLDERACDLAPNRNDCLNTTAMASLVLPFFARPVRQVVTGEYDGGRCGTWLDGGLRSGFPAYRALRMTRPSHLGTTSSRVLAVATYREEDLASSRPTLIHEVALDAIGQMGSQVDSSEITDAEGFEQLRQEAMAVLEGTADAGATSAPRALSPNASRKWLTSRTEANGYAGPVYTVFVPTAAPAQLIAEAGYAFDEYVMRGLFTWGREEAIRRMPTSGPSDSIFKHLGWEAIAGMTWQPAVVADAADLEAYAKAYGMPKPMPECPDHFSARMVQGRARINDDVAACEDVSSDAAPPYFVCGRPQ